MKYLKGMIALIVVVVIAIGVWIWTGAYNIGADSPHWSFTRYLIGQLREHSIESHSANIKVPDLDDSALVAEGAHHYAEMCTGCHLAPGMGDSELRQGLYPRPPNLTHFAPDPAEAFWIIKHGIKMTAMPAWGKTHSDQKIWAMVAYLQKQPHMSVERYRQLAGLPAMAPVVPHDQTPPTASSAAPAMSAPMTVTPAAQPSHAPAVPASTH